jgi:hypothetical protein
MNIEVSSNQGVGDWAPGPSFDGGLTFWEQIRFTCGTNKCNVNIPILSSKYFFHSGGGTNPDATDINLTLFPESNSKVLVLGQTVNYPFTSFLLFLVLIGVNFVELDSVQALSAGIFTSPRFQNTSDTHEARSA